jgi:hypothetical protein
MLETLLAELASGADAKWKLVERSGLQAHFWELMKRAYGYDSETPGLQDFVIELFKSCFLCEVDAGYKPRLTSDAKVFIQRWKDSRLNAQAFEVLSAQCADILQIED